MKITISKKDLKILLKVLREYFDDNLAWEGEYYETPFIPYEKETEMRVVEKLLKKYER